MPFLDALASAIPAEVPLTAEERRAVLEIAWLAVTSDHDVADAELAALRVIAGKLDGAAEIDPLLARFGAGWARDAADARLQELATVLASPAARALAYKAAHALSLADRHASDGEFEFELQLIDALGLPQSEADALAREVDRAVNQTPS